MPELKPCPFCGGEAHVVEGMYSSYQEGYAVRCRHCALTLGASGRLGECYEWSCCYETEAEAIEAWNTRAVEVCEVVGFADAEPLPIIPERTCKLYKNGNCSVCGAYIETITHAVYEMGDMFACSPRYCPNCGAKVVSE